MRFYSCYIVALLVFSIGCQNQGQPFNPYLNTRVPPPGTGTYGQAATTSPYYTPPAVSPGVAAPPPAGAPAIGGASLSPTSTTQPGRFSVPAQPAATYNNSGQWRSATGAPTAQPYTPPSTNYPAPVGGATNYPYNTNYPAPPAAGAYNPPPVSNVPAGNYPVAPYSGNTGPSHIN